MMVKSVPPVVWVCSNIFSCSIKRFYLAMVEG